MATNASKALATSLPPASLIEWTTVAAMAPAPAIILAMQRAGFEPPRRQSAKLAKVFLLGSGSGLSESPLGRAMKSASLDAGPRYSNI